VERALVEIRFRFPGHRAAIAAWLAIKPMIAFQAAGE